MRFDELVSRDQRPAGWIRTLEGRAWMTRRALAFQVMSARYFKHRDKKADPKSE